MRFSSRHETVVVAFLPREILVNLVECGFDSFLVIRRTLIFTRGPESVGHVVAAVGNIEQLNSFLVEFCLFKSSGIWSMPMEGNTLMSENIT